MFIKKLELKNFRLFPFININFTDGINIITGKNGQGKTSILESIYYLTLTKSFRTSNDRNVVKFEQNFFNIQSNFISQTSRNNNIRVFFSKAEGKHLFVDEKRISKFSEFIGTIPCIVLTLNDLKLANAGPLERRRFQDILLSQISPVYLDNLKNYKRLIHQKNALLASENKEKIRNQIEIWNEQLVTNGAQIIQKRLEFVKYFNENLSKYYVKFSRSKESITAIYKSTIGEDVNYEDYSNIVDTYRKKLDKVFDFECERKSSVVGPHRDDIDFYKDAKLFKEFASQGENKTLIIALKFLEWDYISEKKNIKPILLLDDIFSELDNIRMQGLLEFLMDIGQTFITTTSAEKFRGGFISKVFTIDDTKIYDA
jgi:DNA replication and repair protein RecF